MAAPKAWHNVFDKGSKALQNRLREIHKNNPEFHKFLQARGETGESKSAAKAKSQTTVSKEKEVARKTLSLKAYGATKGTKTGASPGSEHDTRDTIAPLTRDQHSKVHAAVRAAKNKESGKPLSKADRIAAIARTAHKGQTKHDVATLDPSDRSHDDFVQSHFRMHYSEEVDRVDETDNTSKAVRMAKGVATDPRYAGGNMTGAAKVIRKIGKKLNVKNLERHPKVQAMLRAANEETLRNYIKENLSNACWKGYTAVGMKKKNGKMVPNCVPVKEQVAVGSSILNPHPKKGGKPRKKPLHGLNKEAAEKPETKSKLEKAISKLKGKRNKINTEPVANSMHPHQLGSHNITGGHDTEQNS